MDKSVHEIVGMIKAFNQVIAQHLPGLRSEVSYLIDTKSKDENAIERMLDTLLSLTMHGMAEDLFIQLLEYYKTVNAEAAGDYWRFYDEQE